MKTLICLLGLISMSSMAMADTIGTKPFEELAAKLRAASAANQAIIDSVVANTESTYNVKCPQDTAATGQIPLITMWFSLDCKSETPKGNIRIDFNFPNGGTNIDSIKFNRY